MSGLSIRAPCNTEREQANSCPNREHVCIASAQTFSIKFAIFFLQHTAACPLEEDLSRHGIPTISMTSAILFYKYFESSISDFEAVRIGHSLFESPVEHGFADSRYPFSYSPFSPSTSSSYSSFSSPLFLPSLLSCFIRCCMCIPPFLK